MGEPVDYARDIQPLLAAKCYKCHGPDAQKSGLRLDTVAAALEGGYSGSAIERGKSGESLLIKAVTGADDTLRMPPEDAPPLAEREIQLLRRWIDEGAMAPAEGVPAAAAKTSSNHWAFQPILHRDPPAVRHAERLLNPIDAFVLAHLDQKEIEPSQRADRATLIRRVSLDLIGLPPTIGEVDDFLADNEEGAYERLVERLLASPHYGERWARHWLDLARYADSNGYTNDNPRSIWKYRDWVIAALNRDLPFDQFTIEQLAGDMLLSPTVEQRVATGFHRNTLLNEEGGVDPEEFRVESIVDRVSTTGTVYLGLTIGCARCHDHKFDPISQMEFYRLFAIFNNCEEPTLALPSPEQTHQLAALEQEISSAKQRLSDDDVKKAQQPNKAREELARHVNDCESKLAALKQSVATTLVLTERESPRETHLLIRGEYLRNGPLVEPGAPEVLPQLRTAGSHATRLDLARWLVDPANPLTARVTVNRVWQQYFGRGLVDTPNDFGTQGSRPTHPELLDWLACQFVENWSLKRLHRLIVTSATYRQTSRARPDLLTLDPDNKLFARQSRLRLDAEVVRDVVLAASGLLSPQIGGPSVFPPQPDGVMALTISPRTWDVSKGEDRYRRGIYTYFWRSTPHPFLKVFDASDGNTTCAKRDRSNTPLQALTLLNDEAFFEASQALASRILRELPSASTDQRLRYAFRLCLARTPSEYENACLVQHLLEELARIPGDLATQNAGSETMPRANSTVSQPPTSAEEAAWTSVARALLNLDEMITRE